VRPDADEPIRALVVEDDPLLAEAHRTFVQRVPGFAVAGVAGHGVEALRFVAQHQIDLVLLDFYLPDISGLEVCRSLRAHGAAVDVIEVTSARDLDVVRTALAYGVVQYLLKPFSFATFRDRLERYADYRRQMSRAGPARVSLPLVGGLGRLGGQAGRRPGRAPVGMRSTPRPASRQNG
jgi:response regulator of citrate/malate metabolism